MKAIAAVSKDGYIGKDGKIPWHIPEEFKWFKQATDRGILIMGRKTVDSIWNLYGGDKARREYAQTGESLLPNRTILTLSGKKDVIDIVKDIAVIQASQEEPARPVWLCGGAQIYELLLPVCDELYLTTVNKDVNGDVKFPESYKQLFRRHETLESNLVYKIERWKRHYE
jgi:dihydrofolate reductase